MKIENDRHPHVAVQRMLQAYDPNLWLVWSPKIRRWLVVLEDRATSHSVHHAIRGLPGCCGERTHFQVCSILWAPDGSYLNPSDVSSQLMSAVHSNDQRNIPLMDRLRASDEAEQARKDKAKRQHSTLVRELARDAYDTVGVGKVMGTSAGTVDYARGTVSSSRSPARKGILASHGLTPADVG